MDLIRKIHHDEFFRYFRIKKYNFRIQKVDLGQFTSTFINDLNKFLSKITLLKKRIDGLHTLLK